MSVVKLSTFNVFLILSLRILPLLVLLLYTIYNMRAYSHGSQHYKWTWVNLIPYHLRSQLEQKLYNRCWYYNLPMQISWSYLYHSALWLALKRTPATQDASTPVVFPFIAQSTLSVVCWSSYKRDITSVKRLGVPDRVVMSNDACTNGPSRVLTVTCKYRVYPVSWGQLCSHSLKNWS